MSNIGDYVHYHAIRYWYYGTERASVDDNKRVYPDGETESVEMKALQRFKDNIIKRANSMRRKEENERPIAELEELINYFYTGQAREDANNNQAPIDEEVTSLFDDIMRAWLEALEKNILNMDMETWEAMTADGKFKYKEFKDQSTKKRSKIDEKNRKIQRGKRGSSTVGKGGNKNSQTDTAPNLSVLKQKLQSGIEELEQQATNSAGIRAILSDVKKKFKEVQDELEAAQEKYYKWYLGNSKVKKKIMDYEKWKETGHRSYRQSMALIESSDGSGTKIAMADDAYNLYEKAQTLLDTYLKYPGSIADVEGVFGEGTALYVSEMCRSVCQGLSLTDAKKAMKEFAAGLKGAERTKFITTTVQAMMKDDRWTGNTKTEYKAPDSSLFIQQAGLSLKVNTKTTRGSAKIDVLMETKNKNDRFSVKNITPYTSFGLHLEDSKRTLIFHLADDVDFANHFLNLVGMNGGQVATMFEKKKQLYIDALRLKVIYNTMSGDGLDAQKHQVANLMYIHDKTTKRHGRGNSIRIIPIADIINKIKDNISDNTAMINFLGKKGNKSISTSLDDDFYIHNEWVGTDPNQGDALQRIAKMIAEISTQKLKTSVSLKPETVIDILTM